MKNLVQKWQARSATFKVKADKLVSFYHLFVAFCCIENQAERLVPIPLTHPTLVRRLKRVGTH